MSDLPDFNSIADALRALTPSWTITLHESSEQEDFSRALRDVAEAVHRVADSSTLRTAEGADVDVPAVPALTFERRGRGAVHYLTRPVGPEAAPLLELLGGAAADLPATAKEALEALAAPARLLVFVAEACPHCPRAVRAALAVAAAGPAVTVAVVDAQRFPGLAERFRVQSAPTTVLDGGLARTGVRTAAEVAADVLARGQVEHETEVFGSLVESSRFDQAADRIVAGHGASQFLALWRKSTTSSRIGLLLTAEHALGARADALHSVAPALAEVTHTDDDVLRGDTADLLGRIDHPAARKALRALLADPNPDVAEIAAEGLAPMG